MVGAAVFGGWMANIDVSQASQGLAGGRSFSEAKGSWGQTRGGNKLEDAAFTTPCAGVSPSLARETPVVRSSGNISVRRSIFFCAVH